MNKITASGLIGSDPEIRHTGSGDAILNFRLASDVGYGDKKQTIWFNCAIWGKRGESLSQHLAKGMPVTVFGAFSMREWQDKEGQTNISPEIRVDEISMQGGKKEEKPTEQRAKKSADLGDDIPF